MPWAAIIVVAVGLVILLPFIVARAVQLYYAYVDEWRKTIDGFRER